VAHGAIWTEDQAHPNRLRSWRACNYRHHSGLIDYYTLKELRIAVQFAKLVCFLYKAVPDGSVFNIRSLIHFVILQSLGDTTFFKRAVETDRHTEPINGSQVPPFNLTVNIGNDNSNITNQTKRGPSVAASGESFNNKPKYHRLKLPVEVFVFLRIVKNHIFKK